MLIWHTLERAKYLHLSPLAFAQFYLEHIASIVNLGEKLNTSVLLHTECRDTRVLSRALSALGSLQLDTLVCVHVSKDLWYLRSILPFYLIVYMRVLTLETQTTAKIKYPGYLKYTINIKYWSFLSIRGKRTHETRTTRTYIYIILYRKSQLRVRMLRSLN